MRDGVQKRGKLKLKKDIEDNRQVQVIKAMETKSVKVLPKTASEIQNGGLYRQRVRCGKSTCKCARGETHTAFYFFARRNGKLVKIYVRKSEVEAFAVMVNLASNDRAQRRQSAHISNELLKSLRESSREYEQMTKLYKEQFNREQS